MDCLDMSILTSNIGKIGLVHLARWTKMNKQLYTSWAISPNLSLAEIYFFLQPLMPPFKEFKWLWGRGGGKHPPCTPPLGDETLVLVEYTVLLDMAAGSKQVHT